MSDQSLNQTQFSVEEPLFEQPLQPKPAATPQPDGEGMPPKKKRSKLFVVGGVVGVFLIAGAIIAFIIMRQDDSMDPLLEETPQTQKKEYGPLQTRLNEIKEELEAADPRQEELPFPPIDTGLSVEPLER